METKKYLQQIMKIEFSIMMGSLPEPQLSRAILHRDNVEKMLIEIHGQNGYEQLRKNYGKL